MSNTKILTFKDLENIIHSSEDSVVRTKRVPLNMDFIKQAYVLLNEHIFENKLPKDIILKSFSSKRGNWFFGCATSKYEIRPSLHFRRKILMRRPKIEINSAFVMPIYDWLHILIHECIHVLDFAINFDNHAYNKEIEQHKNDPHGRFFKYMCETLVSKGFPYVGAFYDIGHVSYNKNDRNGKKYVEENKQFYVVCFDTINDDMDMLDKNECIKINKHYIKHFIRNLRHCKQKGIINTSKIDIYSLNIPTNVFFHEYIIPTPYNKKSHSFDLKNYRHGLFFEVMGKNFLKYRRTVRID